MNKRGVSLVELLAAIVIFGLAISLTATVISLLNSASSRIEINSQANSEALFLDRELKDAILEFSPTTFSTCGGQDCIVLEKEFEYALDPVLDTIFPIIHNPALTHQIEIIGGELKVNGIAVIINNFTLGAGSHITVTQNGNQVYLAITYEFVATNLKVFTFTTSYSFAILPIPAA